MNPFLWILWAVLALTVVFIGAAIVHTIIGEFRKLPPKRKEN